MWIYERLVRVMSPPLAGTLTALWFALLLLAILVGSFDPQADFIYGNV